MWSKTVFIVACLVSSLVAEPLGRSGRIMGGWLTTIDRYPFVAAVLTNANNPTETFVHNCGGAIINNRSVLSATHCTYGRQERQLRLRVGSSFASSGGTVHEVAQIIEHPNYNPITIYHDINIMRSATEIIQIPNLVQQVPIAGESYTVPNNAELWSAGWGFVDFNQPRSEQLRHVDIRYVDREECRRRWGGFQITENHLCAGWLDIGGKSPCTGDSGGPLIHNNNVVVGVVSLGPRNCGDSSVPVIFARVSRYTTWIQNNA